ncbi:MAG TPA: biotin--[acetyl-CoA-carboxylase] ligase [Phycisphaerae bacterium]|nr:biotin--[acetyl-CoA-carboxylase] ligase [Phycisphaerae bacterium]
MTPAAFAHQLVAEDIQRDLGTQRVGRSVMVLPDVDSTNTYALNRLTVDGTVVFAELQTAGRGRLGRPWQSPRGASLTFTTLLLEPPGRIAPTRWMMAGAVAVAQAIARETDVAPVVRWPNDLYVGPRKLAGVLVETRSLPTGRMAVAIGIGVNCLQQPGHFPPDLREKATSLEIESSQPIDRTALARALLRRLDYLLASHERPTDDELAVQWREASADLGGRARLLSDGQEFGGQIIDIHPATGLLLQLDDGGRRQFDPQTTTRL